MSSTVRARQGSQPTYAGVRVGVMAVGEHQGVTKARLLIRSDREGKRVDLACGDSEDLFGLATVSLDEVVPGPGGRGVVTLTFRDATP
ncbi:hypothetical protein [Nocardioides ferulae]|uniref:hypothetical protein n=1 Tax=Nocardioides ferulae TaxID=2340821 RepID=UPI000EB49931|nr:hypothetical protein [Nocardioides ferulae]